MISMSGYGQTGPESGYVSYGPAQVPLSGLSSLTGYAGWQPMHVGMSYGDPNAGLHAAFAVIAALFHRERTGKGQYIDMSQWESSMCCLGEGVHGLRDERRRSRSATATATYMAPHGIFLCAGEDHWITIACAYRRRVARALRGRWASPDSPDDPRFRRWPTARRTRTTSRR